MNLLPVSTVTVIEGWKFWASLAGIGLTIYGAIWRSWQWVKDIREKDLPIINQEVQEVNKGVASLGVKLDQQTSAIVRELSELRSDFRVFYTQPIPQMLPAMAPRKRRAPRKTIKVD